MTARVVFEVPGEVLVVHDASLGEIVATWARFGNPGTFRDCLTCQADLVEAGLARFVIVDISGATGTPSARDHDFVNRFVYPRFRRGGLRAIVTVRPQDSHTRMGTLSWSRSGSAWRFDVTETASVLAAREHLDRAYSADRAAAGQSSSSSPDHATAFPQDEQP